jgi:hypothetical protein
MKDWIMKNLHLNSDAQGNEKYPMASSALIQVVSV